MSGSYVASADLYCNLWLASYSSVTIRVKYLALQNSSSHMQRASCNLAIAMHMIFSVFFPIHMDYFYAQQLAIGDKWALQDQNTISIWISVPSIPLNISQGTLQQTAIWQITTVSQTNMSMCRSLYLHHSCYAWNNVHFWRWFAILLPVLMCFNSIRLFLIH